MEIERKFTVKSIPKDIDSYESILMEQAYLCTDPVVRIRRENDRYVLTYKGSGLMAMEEYNLPLNESAFLHLLPKADGVIVRKRRYLIPEKDGLTIELDVFKEPVDLVMAEVEFPSVEEADAYIPPKWFDKDVTNDPDYHNSNIASGRSGLIKRL